MRHKLAATIAAALVTTTQLPPANAFDYYDPARSTSVPGGGVVSPDFRQAVKQGSDAEPSLTITDVETGASWQVTDSFNPGDDLTGSYQPLWSPNSRFIAVAVHGGLSGPDRVLLVDNLTRVARSVYTETPTPGVSDRWKWAGRDITVSAIADDGDVLFEELPPAMIGMDDTSLLLVDSTSGATRFLFHAYEGGDSGDLTPDGRYALGVNKQQQLVRVDLRDGSQVIVGVDEAGNVLALSSFHHISDDGQIVVFWWDPLVAERRTLRRDVRTGTTTRVPRIEYHVDISSDGRYVLGGYAGTVMLVDAVSGWWYPMFNTSEAGYARGMSGDMRRVWYSSPSYWASHIYTLPDDAHTKEPDPCAEFGCGTETIEDDPNTPPATAELQRLAGADRLGTAVAISKDAWADQAAQSVTLARHDAFPDALAGTPLAVRKNGPLLLTPSTGLNAGIAAEIKRVLPAGRTVYLLGGPAALSQGVADAVARLGYKVARLGGADRYATAVTISKQLGTPSKIFEATGLSFQNALISGVAAASSGGVVVLTADAKMPGATKTYLDGFPGVERVAVGPQAGTADPTAAKVAGSTVYDTARLVAERFFPAPRAAALASGTVFADALAGGAHIGRLGGPLLLSEPTRLPAPIAGYLSSKQASIDTAALYGGPVALSTAVEDGVRANLRP